MQELADDFKSCLSRHRFKPGPRETSSSARWLSGLPSWDDLQHVSWRAAATIPAEIDAVAPQMLQATMPANSSAWWTPRAVHTLLGVTWGFFGTILNVLIIVVLSLYWSIDRIHFERLWLSLLDVGRRQRARESWRAIEQATGAYLQREVVQSLAAGVMLGIGFWAFQQPYPVLSAAVGALAWLIPWVGTPWRWLRSRQFGCPGFFLPAARALL